AQVTWRTSKPADSSVQYSESPLPDKSSYLPALVTNHSVLVSGLQANRTYYYQVVSRDQAGNTVIAPTNGNLFTFQTLKGPGRPWSDNLDTNASGWKVISDSSSDQNWSLGTPHNGLASSAYSGTNAWGSDLDGNQNFSVASSYLYAPVIDLSGLKSATLTFWTTFDFTRVQFGIYEEDGGVFVSTNSSVPPDYTKMPLIHEYVDESAHIWTLESLDLTNWLGQTIQLVFYYQGGTLGDTIYGWTIDDVSITGVTAGGN